MLKFPSFLVVQYGARHQYEIPQAFAKQNALTGVYTDMTFDVGFGAFIRHYSRLFGVAESLLNRRILPDIIHQNTKTFELAFFGSILARRFGDLPMIDKLSQKFKEHSEKNMVRHGIKGATHLYTMLGEGGNFVTHARQSGAMIVSDVYIALSSDQIVMDEASRFPDWADDHLLMNIRQPHAPRANSIMLEQTDIFVCPSHFVANDLIENYGIPSEKVAVIPYAVSPKWLSLAVDPIPGRALFAGSANIRKGIHYLASAATMLRGVCEMRVAGGVSHRVCNHPAAQDLNFLGHLGPEAMATEFAKADVFVFPSLAEGSAGVTAEALGAGIPVVTTKAAGSIVRNGIDGIIVNERDPEAVAEAVRSIVEDRDKRETMSRAARERAQQVTWDGFARQVIEATKRISEPQYQ